MDQGNFYGLTTRDYEKTDTDIATLQVDHDFSGTLTLRNVTRVGQTLRDSVITAPRFASVNTSTLLNRQLQSRDMDDGILANQTNLTARFATGAIEHAVATGVELVRETSVNFARIGPAAPQADLFNPNPDAPYAGPIVRSRRVHRRDRAIDRGVRVRHGEPRQRSGSSPAACDGTASTWTTRRWRSAALSRPSSAPTRW